MTLDELLVRIEGGLEGLEITVDGEDRYYFYDPEKILPVDGRFPFATVMTTDSYDHASDLSRQGFYRVNVGVSRETYMSHFGEPPKEMGDAGGIDTGHDYRAVDQFMPHPVYAAMGWMSIVCPSEQSWERLEKLLIEAHATARKQYEKKKG